MTIMFNQNFVQDEWHFVILKGSSCQEEFYEELECLLAPQIEALNLKSGYDKFGGKMLFHQKQIMHYMKYGKDHYSLTYAEPFGTDLRIAWYLWDAKHNTLRRKFFRDDKVIAFATIGKDATQRAVKAVLSKKENKELAPSGDLV